MSIPLVPYEGLNYLLNTGLKGTAAASHWYVGNITSPTYSPALTDTLAATLASMSESSSFGAARPEAVGTVTNGVFTATAVTLTATAAVTIYGVFIASGSVVGSSTGTLLGAYLFTAPKVMAIGESVTVPVIIPLSN